MPTNPRRTPTSRRAGEDTPVPRQKPPIAAPWTTTRSTTPTITGLAMATSRATKAYNDGLLLDEVHVAAQGRLDAEPLVGFRGERLVEPQGVQLVREPARHCAHWAYPIAEVAVQDGLGDALFGPPLVHRGVAVRLC